jgi:DNA-binding GntR family transcriptional regulator
MAHSSRYDLALSSAQERPPSSPERVTQSITRGLMLREYSVGQRLVEPDLMAKLGVSRSTVREALKILESRGIVEIVPHRGATIRGLTLTDARNLLLVLEVLTGLAARLAAEKIHVGSNARLFAAAAKPLVQPQPSQIDRILDERANYYQCMFKIADSDELTRSMPTSRAHLFRVQVWGMLTKVDLRAMVLEYHQITEAILAGDSVRAEERVRWHLQKSAERFLPHLL